MHIAFVGLQGPSWMQASVPKDPCQSNPKDVLSTGQKGCDYELGQPSIHEDLGHLPQSSVVCQLGKWGQEPFSTQ